MITLPKGCPITLTLLALNIVFFASQFGTQDMLTNAGILYGPLVVDGQYWRIISSGFLHGSIIHIGFNMFLLYMMGPQLEEGLGKARFALIYFGALIGSSLTVLVFGFTQATLGASGAVLGLAGALFVTMWGRGVSPRQSPVFGLVVINLALPLLIPGISFWGHLGGVLFGGLMAFILVWIPDHRRPQNVNGSIIIGIVAVIAMLVASVVLPAVLFY